MRGEVCEMILTIHNIWRCATIVFTHVAFRSVPLPDTTPVYDLFGNEIPNAIIQGGYRSKFGLGPVKAVANAGHV